MSRNPTKAAQQSLVVLATALREEQRSWVETARKT